jgi:zinc transporter ZupT
LTLLAWAGIIAGVFLGQSRAPSAHIAAAGGGLLFGMALFWLLPEMAETVGWPAALLLITFGCAVLWVLDRTLLHRHNHNHGQSGAVAVPLLAAAAVHSLIDGWSVQVFSREALAEVAVPLGLALHKIPEGVALGLLTRKSVSTAWKALTLAGAVEAMTLVGAWIEPRADLSGKALFGAGWSEMVLGIVAGTFLYLGLHTMVPARGRRGILPVFLSGTASVGIAALLHRYLGLA